MRVSRACPGRSCGRGEVSGGVHPARTRDAYAGWRGAFHDRGAGALANSSSRTGGGTARGGVDLSRGEDRPAFRSSAGSRSGNVALGVDRSCRPHRVAPVLRAPWCGLALADLLELCRGDERSTVRELMRERSERLSAQARAALARASGAGRCLSAERARACGRWSIYLVAARRPGVLRRQGAGNSRSEAYFALLDTECSGGAVDDSEVFSGQLHELFAPADTRSASA